MYPKPVAAPEIKSEAVLGDVVTAIASTLRPGTMVTVPALSTALLPCALLPPGALLYPTPLLLPRDGLLLGALRLLLLPGLRGLPLLLRLALLSTLLRLSSRLSALLRLVPLLLFTCLRPFRLLLALLLCGRWRAALFLPLFFYGPPLLLVLLVSLRVRWDHSPEKQE